MCYTGVITIAGALVAISCFYITWVHFTVDTRKALCTFASVLVGICRTLSAVLAWFGIATSRLVTVAAFPPRFALACCRRIGTLGRRARVSPARAAYGVADLLFPGVLGTRFACA